MRVFILNDAVCRLINADFAAANEDLTLDVRGNSECFGLGIIIDRTPHKGHVGVRCFAKQRQRCQADD